MKRNNYRRVLDYEFELSPRAFYQLNSEQANVLYGEAVKALNPKKMTVSSMLTAVLGRLVLQLPKKSNRFTEWILHQNQSLMRVKMLNV